VHKRSYIPIMLIAGVLAALLAACGSSSSTTTGAPANTSSGNASSANTSSAKASSPTATSAPVASKSADPTGAPIVLGNVGSYSGPVSSGIEQVPTLLQRWVKDVNSTGGINGHPVKVISQDDAANPTQTLEDMKQMISVDHVIGFVGNQNPTTDTASEPFLDESKIPVVGGDSGPETWFTHPMYFAVASNAPTTVYGAAKAAAAAGVTKLALMPCGVGTCTEYANLMRSSAEKLGIKVVNEQTVGLTQTQFQANCLAAQGAGADGIYAVSAPAQYLAIMKSCSLTGYRPTYLLTVTEWSNVYLGLPGLKAVGSQGVFPYSLTSGSPALAEWGKAMQGISQDQLSQGMSTSWAATQLAQAALEKGVPRRGKPTTAELLKGLYALKGDTLGGLTMPLTYTAGKPSPEGSCWFVESIENQKNTAPNGDKPTCK
jgi:branched-chain amino acid transport system substrate-binding protein